MSLRAYHGDPTIKATYLARVRAHREADQLIKGIYWQHGKGCAVGCTVHSDNHAAYETELGVPRVLARLEDGLFERLPNGQALAWPAQFLEAIPVGADLSLVWPQFAVWLLVDPTDGVIQFAKTERVRQVIQNVADAYVQVTTWPVEKKQRRKWRALREVAYAADAAAAAYAAYAAAYAAYAAADAAISIYHIRQSEKLLALLRVAPVAGEART